MTNHNKTKIQKKNHIYTNYKKSVTLQGKKKRKKIYKYILHFSMYWLPQKMRQYNKEINKMYKDIAKNSRQKWKKITHSKFCSVRINGCLCTCIFGKNKNKNVRTLL